MVTNPQPSKLSGLRGGFSQSLEIIHEIAHTMPYLWSGKQMVAECSVDYHDMPHANVAYGVDVGARMQVHRDSFMSQIYADPSLDWIDQCTYVPGPFRFMGERYGRPLLATRVLWPIAAAEVAARGGLV